MGDQKRFRIHSAGFSIPWPYVEPLRSLADEVHGQTLERLTERGGLDRSELGGLLDGRNVFGGDGHTLSGCEDSLSPGEARRLAFELLVLADLAEAAQPSQKGDS